MKKFKCSECGKPFDNSSNAKRHVNALGKCRRDNAFVVLSDVVIRASDRVVGGHKRVEDFGVASRRVPAQEDDEPNMEPAVDIDPEQPVEEPERTEGFPDSDFWYRWRLIALFWQKQRLLGVYSRY